MLKNKIKIISLITLLVISLLIPISNAENEVNIETTSTEQVNPIMESQEEIPIKKRRRILISRKCNNRYTN